MNRVHGVWQFRQEDTAIPRSRYVKCLGEDCYQTVG